MSMFLWAVLVLAVVVPLALWAVCSVLSGLGNLIDMFVELVTKE